ncbi:MAG: DUF3991 and toprim domain-containing protein [Oscillospiraceae bacterium]|nr:DUF3991 and toprim domain-containing protein [Oscillospiraceae bacterium]
MAYYSSEQILKAKSIDLLTYLQENEPHELVHINGNNYTTKTHDSLKISNGKWNWFSQGIGGKTAINYLTEVRGYTFLEAMDIMTKNANIISKTDTVKSKKITAKNLILPIKADNNFKIIQYLKSRGIDSEVINYCIDKGLIYQEKDTNNVVFIGYDNNKNPHYVGLRGITEKRFMKEATGSKKEYSFRLESATKNNTVHIFESSIDLLSYATILKSKNRNWKEENLLSLAGIYQPQKVIGNSKIPKAIEIFLSQNPHIKCIILHLDRDVAGRNSAIALQTVISKKYTVIDSPPTIGKDVNEYLCSTKKLLKQQQDFEDR